MKKLILPIVFFILSACYYDSEEALFGKPGACNTTDTKFSTAVQPILNTYCVGCHNKNSSTTDSGGIFLTDHKGVIAVKDRIVGSIEHTSGFSNMPRTGGTLSKCDISIIKAWITANALDN